MADLKDTIEKLKLVEQEMDVYKWYQEAGLGDAVRDAIERLEPRQLTPDDIVTALNASSFLGATDWGCHIDDEIDRPYFTPDLSLHVRLELGESQIVAQGLLRAAGPIEEKEAARG